MAILSSSVGRRRRRYLPVISGVDQPGAVAARRVKVGIVRRAEGAVEVPQPFSARGNVAVDLVAEVLPERQKERREPKNYIRQEHLQTVAGKEDLNGQ